VAVPSDALDVGSGPGGLAAAVSSARAGVPTMLVERYGCLGGNLTHVGDALTPLAEFSCIGIWLAKPGGLTAMKEIREPSRLTPVLAETDVLIGEMQTWPVISVAISSRCSGKSRGKQFNY
jgi:hypothetical protein